jgi:AraC-like DNA-binding protein
MRDRLLAAAQICSAFYISRSTLYELFKPEGGIRRYLQKRRLELARLTLEDPAYRADISEIAQRLGFRSLSSFSRSFRDHWGTSPRETRKEAVARSETRSPNEEHTFNPQPNNIRIKRDTQNYYKAIEAMSATRPPN